MKISRQKISQLLRKANLLQLADSALLIFDIFKNRKSNQLFLENHTGFSVPPYTLTYDAYNHTNWQVYYDMGLRHAHLVSDLLKEYICGNEIRVCEWGCGPARVIRHIEKVSDFSKIELYGTDYNKHSIAWCQKNIKKVHFSMNRLEPPLNIENDYFNCIYAISIFTHLSERMHYAWIEELFKKLKPNGILIFTTHGDICAKRLLPQERRKYDAGSLVVKDQIKEGKKHFLAYQPPQFVKNNLLKKYTILKRISNPIEYNMEQEVWVAAKCE